MAKRFRDRLRAREMSNKETGDLFEQACRRASDTPTLDPKKTGIPASRLDVAPEGMGVGYKKP